MVPVVCMFPVRMRIEGGDVVPERDLSSQGKGGGCGNGGHPSSWEASAHYPSH